MMGDLEGDILVYVLCWEDLLEMSDLQVLSVFIISSYNISHNTGLLLQTQIIVLH